MRARSMVVRSVLLGGVTLVLLGGAALGQARQPRLKWVRPLGAEVGSELKVRIGGKYLDGPQKLVFSHSGIEAEQIKKDPNRFYPEPRPVKNRFRVKVSKGVPSGVYEVRLVGKYGVSNARFFEVGKRPSVSENESNDQMDRAQSVELGSVVNGRFDGRSYDHYRFTAKKGQRLILFCKARGLDSRGDPTLVLFNSDGDEIVRDLDTRGRDAMIDYRVTKDGEYVLRAYDFRYRGGGAFPYRLRLSTGPWVDFVDPPVVVKGKATKHTVYGRNLPGGKASDVKLDENVLERKTVRIKRGKNAGPINVAEAVLSPVAAASNFLSFQIETEKGRSNAVRLPIVPGPILREKEPNDSPKEAQTISPPGDFIGRFNPKGDRDFLAFNAKKGKRLAIDVYSRRLGHPTDPVLFVQRVKDNGFNNIKRLDDRNHRRNNHGNALGRRFRIRKKDPSWVFKAPADGKYRLFLRDLYSGSQGGPDYFYRLSLRKPSPGYQLVAMPHQPKGIQFNNNRKMVPRGVVVRPGGAEPVTVVAFRKPGSREAIRVSVKGLPKGVEADPIVIPRWKNYGAVVLRAKPDAAGWDGSIRIVGKMKADGETIRREAKPAELAFSKPNNDRYLRARQRTTLRLAVPGEQKATGSVKLGKKETYKVKRGKKVKIPVKLAKHRKLKGNAKLQPIGVHKRFNAGNVKVSKKKQEKTLQLNIKGNAPTGKVSFFLQGKAKTPFRLNPEKAKKAKEAQKRIAKLQKKFQKRRKEAKQKRKKAKREISRSKKALQQAKKAKQQAEKTLAKVKKAGGADALKALAAAEKKLEKAKKAVKSADGGDAKKAAKKSLQQAKQAKKAALEKVAAAAKKADLSQKKVVAAASKAEAKATAVADAQKALEAAKQKRKSAAKAFEKYKKLVKRAKNKKKQAKKRAKKLKKRAKKKDIQVPITSDTVTLHVVKKN